MLKRMTNEMHSNVKQFVNHFKAPNKPNVQIKSRI